MPRTVTPSSAARSGLLLDLLLVLLRLFDFLLTNLVSLAHDQLLLVVVCRRRGLTGPQAVGRLECTQRTIVLPTARKSRSLSAIDRGGPTGEIARRPGALKIEAADPPVAIENLTSEI